ncbi:MAG: hypothetical protein ACK5TH_19850 [Prosthecobacter sp.]|jgi:hypothetical protein
MSWQSRILLILLLSAGVDIHAQQGSMQERAFRVPSDFMLPEGKKREALAADPFATPAVSTSDGTQPPIPCSHEVLQSFGITFPEGAKAFWDVSTGTLTIRNTAANIDLVASLIEELQKQEGKTIRFHLRVIEALPSRLSSLLSSPDVTEALKKLLAAVSKTDGKVRLVQEAFIENPSGKRATHESITDHAFCTGLEWDAGRRISVPYERRATGFIVEMEPVIMADGEAVESRVHLAMDSGDGHKRELKVTEPVSGQITSFPIPEWQMAHLQTSAAVLDGKTRLIGMMPKPGTTQPGEDDLAWAVFLTARIVPVLPPSSLDIKPADLTPAVRSVVRPVPPGLLEMAEIPPRTPAIERLFQRMASEQERAMVKEANLGPLGLFLLRQGIPHHPDSLFEFKDDGLHITNTPENIERIDAMLAGLVRKAPKAPQFLIEVLKAPEAFWIGMSAEAVQSANHERLWQKAAEALANKEIARLESVWLEGAEDARFFCGRDHGYMNGLNLDAQARPSLVIERQLVGTEVRLNLATQNDLALSWAGLRLEYDSAPETRRLAAFRQADPPRDFELPFTDFHRAFVTRDFAVREGSTRFLGFWRPQGLSGSDKRNICHAAFVRCRQVLQVPPKRVLHWLKPWQSTQAEKLETRSFRVPKDVLNKPAPRMFRRPEVTPDPFAMPRSREPDVVGNWLMSSGLFHADGASASYSAATNTLLIRSTTEELNLVDQFVDAVLREEARTIGLTLRIVEAPDGEAAKLADSVLDLTDHRGALQNLLASGKARDVAFAHVETKPGTPASTKQTTAHTHLRELNVKADGTPNVTTEERETGLIFEASSELDNTTETLRVKLSIHQDISPPSIHREQIKDLQTGKNIEVPLTDFEHVELQTKLTLTVGTTRLLAMWTPKDRPGIKRMAFLECEARSLRP